MNRWGMSKRGGCSKRVCRSTVCNEIVNREGMSGIKSCYSTWSFGISKKVYDRVDRERL